MKRFATGSCRVGLSSRHGLRALSEIAQRPFPTARTSVTPSPVKSPKRSLLIGKDEPPTYSQSKAGSDNFFTHHSPLSLRKNACVVRRLRLRSLGSNRPNQTSLSGFQAPGSQTCSKGFHGAVPPLEIIQRPLSLSVITSQRSS